MAGPLFFAWCDEADVFGPDLARHDEEIFALDLGNSEGNFASLQIDVINHRGVGYLAPGRHQWCWLSWFDGSTTLPLYHGRLLAVPDNTQGETVRLMFVAKPSDYLDQKAALAATLRELPWHDPIFQEQQAIDDDSVLETRVGHWYIDPVALLVSFSEDLAGDDTEIIEVTADDHFYSGVELTYSATPKRRVKVKATGSYVQSVSLFEVNLTAMLVKAFQDAGSVFDYPLIGSFTSDGLLNTWPKAGQSLGGGWSMGTSSFAIPADFASTPTYSVRYTDKSDSTSVLGSDHRDNFGNILPGFQAREFFVGWINYDVTFSVSPILVDFIVMCDAARKRTEEITFTMAANVQSVLTDPGDTEEDAITLTSSLIDQPVDDGGALPIGDARRNCYFPTDRGGQSVQFLMLLAAAGLLRGSRIANVKFRTSWEFMAERVATNKSVHLINPHLPGGQCVGKIIDYHLIATGKGGNVCDVTIACSVGYGVALPAAAEGVNTWADDWADGWTESIGKKVAVIPGQLLYGALDGTVVIDDDGVDLFKLTPETIVTELTVTNGPNDQYNAINGSLLTQHDNARISTTGDVLGTAVTNLKDPTGLISGLTYDVMGLSLGSLNGPLGTPTTFLFDGTNGGTLSQPGPIATDAPGYTLVKGVALTFTRPAGSVFTPDPIAALKDTVTTVTLGLVSTDGGDFFTQFDIPVDPLMVPKTIDLEAPSL